MPPLQSMGAPAQQMQQQQQPGTLRVSGLSDPQVAMDWEGNHGEIADVSWRFLTMWLC